MTSPWPNASLAPSASDLSRCVHCGLCLNSCPTYLATGLETESPRGRIALARGVAEGAIALTATVEGHWDLCLQCRACEVACPSGVQYGRIIAALRVQTAAAPRKHAKGRLLRRFVLRNVIGRAGVLRLALRPVRAHANHPLGAITGRLLISRLPNRIARLERQLVRNQGAPVRPGAALPQPQGGLRSRAVLFTGCVMGELFGEVHRSTARLLARRGVAVEASRGQECCGALSGHDGDIEQARRLARRNIAALEHDDRPIVVNAAGCGAAMKEYGELLADDPAWSERAARFSARVRDLSEYVCELGVELPSRLEGRVAYQDPCHLAHAQRITSQPRTLLGQVEGCELIASPDDSTCCGAAGLYSLVQPAMSDQLRANKGDQLGLSRPDIVVTANPGCHMQLQSAVKERRLTARVMHIAEFLDQAERLGTGSEPPS